MTDASQARDPRARDPLSEEERAGGRLMELLRLPRHQALERVLYLACQPLYSLTPPAWLSGLLGGGTRTREPLALVPDSWPGNAAVGQEIAAGRFPLLGRTLTEPQPPFRPVGAEPRWIAALNGFSWLRHLRAAGGDQARRAARDLVATWIEREGRWSQLAWAPATLGERLGAWLGHYEFYGVSAEVAFRQRLLASIARQARHLSHVLPAGLTGAALIQAIKGLAYAGAACEEGGPWLRKAAALLARELPRQVLPDGGHVERAPSTQLAVLRDLIDLRAVLHAAAEAKGVEAPPALADAIEQMAPTLRLLQHGDGALSLFNGGGEGDPVTADLVLQRASGRLRPLMSAPHAGFQRLQAGRLVVIVDAGAPPPPGLDQAAHAGTLAFEVSVGRERLVVNCGAHPGDPAWRKAQRATAAHSTLTLADHNSSAVLPGGLGRRPTMVTCRRDEAEGNAWLDMSHDGWQGRHGVVHHRKLYLDKSGDDLRGEERLEGGHGGLSFALRFHLHPDVRASLAQGNDAALLRLPKGDGWRLRAKGGEVSLEPSVYLGRAGEVRKALQVVVSGTTKSGETLVNWALQRESKAKR